MINIASLYNSFEILIANARLISNRSASIGTSGSPELVRRRKAAFVPIIHRLGRTVDLIARSFNRERGTASTRKSEGRASGVGRAVFQCVPYDRRRSFACRDLCRGTCIRLRIHRIRAYSCDMSRQRARARMSVKSASVRASVLHFSSR